MLICSYCQSTNPPGHKFCQSCGQPLSIQQEANLRPTAVEQSAETHVALQATLMSAGAKGNHTSDMLTLDVELDSKPDVEPRVLLSPGKYLDSAQRYQVLTVLNEKTALVQDTQPEERSPLQTQLSALAAQPSLDNLQAIPELPKTVYPYCLLSGSAPRIYDAWSQATNTVVITHTDISELSSILLSFAVAADALKHVYWLYSITDLWVALESIPQWRSSLLLTDHLGIDEEHSVQVRYFAGPSDPPPEFPQLKAFLRSLLAQPNRVTVPPDPRIRDIILTVSSATTLDQLRSELANIGEFLLNTSQAITPLQTHSPDSPLTHTTSTPDSAPIMEENTTPTDRQTSTDPAPTDPASAASIPIEADPEFEGIEFLDEPLENDEATMVLPMKLVGIEEAGRTDVGRQRDHNEDCFFISSSTRKHADNNGQTTKAHSLYVLCDGMGGHDGGEVASRLAAETLSAYFNQHWPHPLPNQPMSPLPSQEIISAAVKLANQAIFEVNEKEGRAGHERMGTTLVMVLVQGTEAAVAHVGDSRLYQHARRLGLRQVTTDHEVGQREIARGIPHDLAYARPDAYQLTQALGPRGNEDLSPDVAYLSFSEDTLLLLCSDGLSDNNLIEDHLDSHIDPILRGKKDLDMGMDELIKLANEVNGHDNISAIAIRMKVSPDLGSMNNRNITNRGITVLQ
ncbi:MAG: serine/threonine phosphatase [Phormidesmis sp.]